MNVLYLNFQLNLHYHLNGNEIYFLNTFADVTLYMYICTFHISYIKYYSFLSYQFSKVNDIQNKMVNIQKKNHMQNFFVIFQIHYYKSNV